MLKTMQLIVVLCITCFSSIVIASKDAKVEVVENYIKALNTKDITIISSMYSKNATLEDPVGTPIKQGHEQIMNFYKEGAFQGDIAAELSGPIRIAGDSAAFSFVVFFNGMKIEVIDVFVFDQRDKVTSMKAYWSNANVSPIK